MTPLEIQFNPSHTAFIDTTTRTQALIELVLPVATASVARCFLAMKIVKTVLRNRIGDDFINHCIIYILEQRLLYSTPRKDVIDRFHKMKNHRDQKNCEVITFVI
jgi:hypothetical protein